MSVVRFAEVGEVAPVPLTDAEERRVARLRREEDRLAYRAAHALVRRCAGDLLGVGPEALTLAQRCPTCDGCDHGAPYIVEEPAVHVSLAHSSDHVAAVAAQGPCGVDVETLRPLTPPTGALTPDERAWVDRQPDPTCAFLGLWTRKEALVKAGLLSLSDLATHDARAADVSGATVHDWSSPRAVGAWVLR